MFAWPAGAAAFEANSQAVGGYPSPFIAAKGQPSPHRCVKGGQFRGVLWLIDPCQPIARRMDRPVGECGSGGSAAAVPQPRPPPVFRPLHEVRPQGISLRMAADDKKMLVGGDRKRLEPPLVETIGTRPRFFLERRVEEPSGREGNVSSRRRCSDGRWPNAHRVQHQWQQISTHRPHSVRLSAREYQSCFDAPPIRQGNVEGVKP